MLGRLEREAVTRLQRIVQAWLDRLTYLVLG